MTDLSSIFDGVIDTDIPIKPPIAVLKELGQEFEKLTKGLLITGVTQHFMGDTFFTSFVINAPSLNNYTYEVFSVTHDLGFYPLSIRLKNKLSKKAVSQEEFEAILKEVFSSPEVKKVVNGLLTQIKYA
jgi:hypothetical protein